MMDVSAAVSAEANAALFVPAALLALDLELAVFDFLGFAAASTVDVRLAADDNAARRFDVRAITGLPAALVDAVGRAARFGAAGIFSIAVSLG